MLRLKVLGTQLLGGAATRRFRPLCVPFSSRCLYHSIYFSTNCSRQYSTVAKDSISDDSSSISGSSTPNPFAVTQTGLSRNLASKIYVKHTFYKGEGALGMHPKAPDYLTLQLGGITRLKEGCMFLEFAPAVSSRQYDWSKKKVIALSVAEIGTLLSLGPDEPCEFTHDPFMGKSEAGKIMKVLKVGMLQDKKGYFFNLRVSDRIENVDESFSIHITKGEFSVMQTTFNYILPYLMGWQAYMDYPKASESGLFKSASSTIGKRPDLEWGR